MTSVGGCNKFPERIYRIPKVRELNQIEKVIKTINFTWVKGEL